MRPNVHTVIWISIPHAITGVRSIERREMPIMMMEERFSDFAFDNFLRFLIPLSAMNGR